MKKQKKRFHWLADLVRENNYTIGAEIGVANGITSHRLLRWCPGLTLICVDKWEKVQAGPEGGDIGDQPGCENWDPVRGWERFQRGIVPFKKRVRVLRGDSVEMAEQVKDNSLDFVFIDADHRYPAVKADIQAWTPKLKPGGTLCGHDLNHPRCPGVLKALQELVPNFVETGINHVWTAKKEDYVG